MNTEADTCRKYVVPKLLALGWDSDPHSIAEQRTITDGRVIPVGKEGFIRKPPKRVDYLLRYTRDFPIAVVEAKASYKTATDAVQQARLYAEMLDLKFAYATNGTDIIEIDYFTGTEKQIPDFPKPDDLWHRYQTGSGITAPQQADQLIAPYNTIGGKPPRYYQQIAINRTVEAILAGKRRLLLTMATGTGKSNAIRQLLRQVRERGESAIVYDPAIDFVSEFYSPARGDLILNPLDQRCPYWGLGDEIDRDETATTIAAAFLPEREYEKEFFTDGPRRILAHLLKRQPQPRDILSMMAEPSRIEFAVKGTPLAALLDAGAPAQRAGVLASLNMVADCLELLPEWEHTRPTFATSEWYVSRKRWVFLTSSPAYRAKILPLHSVWLDLFILRMMGYCEDHTAKPVWFVLDELASLNKLPQLHTAVTENRKYGNPVVVGFQGRSQLEKRYGKDAEAMLSQPATKLFFKTTEPRAAKWISDAIGEIEVERLKESRSMRLFGSRKSYAMEIATKPLIMASEISGLEPLYGFIKQENKVVPVHFQFAKEHDRQQEFIERKLPEIAPRPSPPTPVAHTEQPKTSAATQATLPFSDLSTDKPDDKLKEAFVWNESKGIE